MVANGSVVVRLSDLVDGQEAVCYAALVKKTRGMTKSNQPYVKCYFRDKRVQYEAPLWHDHRRNRAIWDSAAVPDRVDHRRLLSADSGRWDQQHRQPWRRHDRSDGPGHQKHQRPTSLQGRPLVSETEKMLTDRACNWHTRLEESERGTKTPAPSAHTPRPAPGTRPG